MAHDFAGWTQIMRTGAIILCTWPGPGEIRSVTVPVRSVGK